MKKIQVTTDKEFKQLATFNKIKRAVKKGIKYPNQLTRKEEHFINLGKTIYNKETLEELQVQLAGKVEK